ncbi:ATP-dependent DNA helicase [Frankliniella fusca]|uniref:ATP-dependent DNA helicase n=1 Tax=Frankliniella fusca TaxID=407009 RepID=A0AAE1GTG5_9NEOP|nr:ATP-dependent DNA helicase [Frankliniella fusca]
MSKSSVGTIYINSCPADQRVFLKKGKKELEKICETDPNSTDIQETGMIEHYIERPDILESTCLADFAALYKYSKTHPHKKNVSTDENEIDLEINDDEIIAEKNSDDESNKKTVYELKNNSGFLTKRNKRLVIQFRNYKEGEDKLNFQRENLMLFTSWRTEPSLLDPDLPTKFSEKLEVIQTNRSNYCKYDSVFYNIEVDLLEEDEENEEESTVAPQFKILDLNETPSDFQLEIPHTEKIVSTAESMRFPLPNLLHECEFLALMKSLNEKQRKYLLNLTNLVKTNPSEPFYHFLSGGAGVGKSTLINAIKQVLERFWVHQPGNKPEDINILAVAPTGKAAIGINGITIDSAFGFGFNVKDKLRIGRMLNSDTRNTLACTLHKLKLIILDEISMCSFYKFQAMNSVLQEIFENNKPFGGVSVITVGDFNQLPPPIGSYVFQTPSDDFSRLLGPHLWRLFQLFELTEIMRQRDDAAFANALNNLALGTTTDEQDEMFTNRQLDMLQIDVTSIIDKVTTLYYCNADVDAFNNLFLAVSPNEKIVSRALDSCSGTKSRATITYMLSQAQKLQHKKTQNMQYLLKLCVETKYIVSHNVAVPDGISNGSPCILKKVIYGQLYEKNSRERIPIRAYVQFEKESTGEKTRQRLQNIIKADGITEKNWTPIQRICRSFSLNENTHIQVTRNQLPLLPSNAQTIHCSQSCTYDNILVFLNKNLSR